MLMFECASGQALELGLLDTIPGAAQKRIDDLSCVTYDLPELGMSRLITYDTLYHTGEIIRCIEIWLRLFYPRLSQKRALWALNACDPFFSFCSSGGGDEHGIKVSINA